MKIVKDKITITELKEICKSGLFIEVVKAVVDVEKELMAIDAEMHADLMGLLMEQENSHHQNLWGVNLYPNELGEKFIMFTSYINIKPSLGNKSTEINDSSIREKITAIINKFIQK